MAKKQATPTPTRPPVEDEDDDLTPLERFVMNVRRLRNHNNWTQEELAKRVGIPRSRVADVERMRGDMRISQIQRFATAFGIPTRQMLGRLRLPPKPIDS